MSAFKEQFRQDLDQVFFNLDEFAELHTLDGRVMPVVLDSSLLEQKKAAAGYAGDIHAARLLLFVKASDFGPKPAADTMLKMDSRVYRVLSASGEDVYEITLGAWRG